ncbi:tetratricopeptide repeat protein [Catenuloplanes atrovinosus]|uniref:Tetratricopeptide (TPR) repeat protein n=1 Tax=Catenuloplanes atrovinosus TaxID=137266 RepID=A0AAE3YTS3_9ACTN|nr:tetratricopeptide repeat protein [Catenuloplanes atrovinosus]MDR7277746.1 tetratricopeptide (TPR) repeat protein [Catenuloplanes atrovinosus]
MTPARSGTVHRAGLLDALCRAHAALLTDTRVAALPPTVQHQLSQAADTLGIFARDHGRAADAQTIFITAFLIDQRRHVTEPGNTGYARDLSVSYDRLGDLARAVGQGERAAGLYQQALTIRERLAAAEPDNTGHARDLSISYERLGDLAVRAGRMEEARTLLRRAAHTRRTLLHQEPARVDLAEELSVTLAALADTLEGTARTSVMTEIITILTPLQHAGILTAKGTAVIHRANP